MKKRYLLPCIMLIICMMLTACTTPSQNISNNTPPATEQPATEQPTTAPSQNISNNTPPATEQPTTEQPTTAPDTEAPESSTPEPNSELDCFDRDMVLAFLETEDENGVKNGEKINPAYNPLDYNTWHFGSRGQNCNGFYFNGDGRLSYVALRGVLNYSGKLVGELNLETCYRLHYLFVESQNIESIKLSSEFDILKVIGCPELLVISAEEASVRYCTIENCPNVKWFMWNVDGTLTEFWDGTGRDYYTLDSEIEIRSEGGGRFDLLVDDGDEYTGDFVPYLRAVPDEGHEFLGWYHNNTGELLSTDLEVRFFDDSDEPSPNFYDLTGTLFMFITARFSE